MVMARQLTDPVAYHGEGVVWSDAWGGLKWVDMLAGDILSLRPDETVTRQATGSRIAAMVRPRASGGLIVFTERGYSLWTDSSLEWSSPALFDDARRFNEGGCMPDGSVLCGTIADSRETGSGDVWRIGADNSAAVLLGDVTISNGLGFTAAGDRMYYVDSRTRRVDVFDVAGGQLVDRRPHVSLPDGVGNPDGLTVDAEGGIWVALYNGAAVHHYDALGVLVQVFEVPASRATSCTLGGPGLATLFITTSRESLSAEEEPLAGSIFTADAGVAGLPVLDASL